MASYFLNVADLSTEGIFMKFALCALSVLVIGLLAWCLHLRREIRGWEISYRHLQHFTDCHTTRNPEVLAWHATWERGERPAPFCTDECRAEYWANVHTP